MVELLLAKQVVVGSNPILRSNIGSMVYGYYARLSTGRTGFDSP